MYLARCWCLAMFAGYCFKRTGLLLNKRWPRRYACSGEPAPVFTQLEISSYSNSSAAWESKEMTVTLRTREKSCERQNPISVLAPYGGYNVYPEWITVTRKSAEYPQEAARNSLLKLPYRGCLNWQFPGVQIAFTMKQCQHPIEPANYIHACNWSSISGHP